MAASSSRLPHGMVDPSRSVRNPTTTKVSSSRPSQRTSSRRQEKRAAVYDDDEDEEDDDDDEHDDPYDGERPLADENEDHNDLVNARFHRAVDIIQSLPKSGPITTTYEEKLMLYSCYKQATEGPVKIPRPSILDLLGRAKWDAWKKREALSKSQAQELYVDTLLNILKSFSDRSEAVALINELRTFGIDTDEQTDDFESVSSSQRSASPPSTSRRTYHSAVPSNVENRSQQGDVTPKRKAPRYPYNFQMQQQHPQQPQYRQGQQLHSGQADDEETVSERSSSDPTGRYGAIEQQQQQQQSYSDGSFRSRQSPYQHPAQYPAPVSAQLPPHLPAASTGQHGSRNSLGGSSKPSATLRPAPGSAVPSISAFPPDLASELQSIRSRHSSNNPPAGSSDWQQQQQQGGTSASVPTLPSQINPVAGSSISAARQPQIDRALDSIQTSLRALHERLTHIENAQMEQSQHLQASSSPSYFANSPILQLLSFVFGKILSFLRIRRGSTTSNPASLTALLSRALVSLLAGIRDLSRDAVAVIFLAGAIAALRTSRGDWRAVIRAWARILAMASGIGFAREGLLLGGGSN